MTGIFFAHPHTLFDQVGKVLNRVGPEKFFTSPDEEVKKAREGFAAYFFTLTLKQYTGRDWWLAQHDQAVKAYPDFDFISFAENPDDIKMEPVELTGVYPHFKSFDDALKVVEKKQRQYGNKPVKFSLLGIRYQVPFTMNKVPGTFYKNEFINKIKLSRRGLKPQ